MTETRENTAAPAAQTRIPFLRKLLFAVVPCVLAFALLEIAFRLIGWGAPEIAPPSSSEFREVELTAPDAPLVPVVPPPAPQEQPQPIAS